MKDLASSKKKIRKFIRTKSQTPKSDTPAVAPVEEQKKPPIEKGKKESLFKHIHLRKRLEKVVSTLGTSLEKIFKKISIPRVNFNLKFKPVQLSKLGFIRKNRGLRMFVKKRESDLQLALFPLILLLVLAILNLINSQLFSAIAQEEFHATSVTTKLHPYPFVQDVKFPQLSANAAIIVDADSQVILFSKNPELRFSMASTTKIMTALTGLDHYALDQVLTIKSSGVEGSGLGLVRGDTFAFKDLLYAMMLPSANDAAQAIADNYPEGKDAFIGKMNEKAQKLHLDRTHYADAAGLDDDGDYTTVIDLSRLASYAIANPTFVEITSTRNKTIHNKSYTRSYPLTNLNRLLGTNGVTGIKTGTTEGAGEVLVTSVVKNGHTYIIVVMQSENRFADTQTLMNFIDTGVKYVIPEVKY